MYFIEGTIFSRLKKPNRSLRTKSSSAIPINSKTNAKLKDKTVNRSVKIVEFFLSSDFCKRINKKKTVSTSIYFSPLSLTQCRLIPSETQLKSKQNVERSGKKRQSTTPSFRIWMASVSARWWMLHFFFYFFSSLLFSTLLSVHCLCDVAHNICSIFSVSGIEAFGNTFCSVVIHRC